MRNRRMRSWFVSFLVFSLAGLVAQTTAAQTSEGWVESYDRLLKKYVTPAGVKYAAWKSNGTDLEELQKVIDAIGTTRPESMGRDEQLAFYINAYNAWILHEALEKYPTKSVKDALFLFFITKRIKVAGQQTSFDQLEKGTIRSKFGDPRIHFALNCASKSCPPLSPEVFRGNNLGAQMDRLTRDFINSPKGVTYHEETKKAELSKIFDWYKGDFKEGGPIAFINKHRSTQLPNDVKISYQEYDWSLNEVR